VKKYIICTVIFLLILILLTECKDKEPYPAEVIRMFTKTEKEYAAPGILLDREHYYIVILYSEGQKTVRVDRETYERLNIGDQVIGWR